MTFLAIAALIVWIGLAFFRGGFWRADQRLSRADDHGGPWPRVVAVIPARNEIASIARTVASLKAQDYPGDLKIIVVDDNSVDGTGAAAQAAGADLVLAGRPLPEAWSGKLWAVSQGVAAAGELAPDAAFLLLTDADIAHDSGNLKRLVAKADAGKLDLVSLMVRLNCETAWERLLIPAFVFFFQKLFPFPWVNDPARETAAAAGGCMLVRRDALQSAGGIEAIRSHLIDDCALARLLKARGAVWLGLTETTVSLRRYDRLGEIWMMVARTAYEQLDHSRLNLACTVLGMALLYVVPPLAVAGGLAAENWLQALAGAVAWGLMAALFRPTLRLYGRPALEGLLLPLAGLLYGLMTVDSARRHSAGRGGAWKGRAYARTKPVDRTGHPMDG